MEPQITRDASGKFVRDDTALAALIDEVIASVIEGFTILIEPKVSRERMGVTLDRLYTLREISRSIDPNGGDDK